MHCPIPTHRNSEKEPLGMTPCRETHLLKIGVSLMAFLAWSGVVRAQTHLVLSDSSQLNPIHISFPVPTGGQAIQNVTNTNAVYGSGPVMRNPTNYLVFWQPPGRAAFPAGY